MFEHLLILFICSIVIFVLSGYVSVIYQTVFFSFSTGHNHRLRLSVDASVCLWKPGCSSKSIGQGAGKRAEGLLI